MVLSLERAHEFVRLLESGDAAVALRPIRKRLRSHVVSYGLRRDLTVPFSAPPARIELDVRPLAPDDDLSFLNTGRGPGFEDNWERLARRRLVEARLGTCWVAIAPDGKPAYMQWLIGPRDNPRIRARWGNLFPTLAPNEALLEGAYTPVQYRGLGVMPHAMARIAEAASDLAARFVITFVTEENIPSLKGCKKAGFWPYVERRHSWLLFRRHVEFIPLPAGTPYPFDRQAS